MKDLTMLTNLINDDDKIKIPTDGIYKATVSFNKNTYNLQKDIKINLEAYAIYDCKNPKTKQGYNHYYLEFKIKNPIKKRSWVESSTLVTLLQNPSNTLPKEDSTIKIDTTIQNVVRIAYLSGYKKIVVLNIFPLIDGNSSDTKKFLNENPNKSKTNINTEFIKKYFENNAKNFDFLIAWGSRSNILKQIKEAEYYSIINQIENKWAFGINDNNTPNHPGNQAHAAIPFIKRMLDKNDSVMLFKINKILPNGTISSYKIYNQNNKS